MIKSGFFLSLSHTHSDSSLPALTLDRSGSVATIAIVHSLDEPRNPFFNSEKLHLIIAHLGDTRALLCTAPEGEAVILTEKHHPEARSETDRLMRTRTGAVTDSFGEVGLFLFLTRCGRTLLIIPSFVNPCRIPAYLRAVPTQSAHA